MPKRITAPKSVLTETCLTHTFYKKDSFYNKATALRNHFDDVFRDPRSTDSRRFTWDYWHIKGQYNLLRTPATQFFPNQILSPLLQSICQFGERNLGCRALSHVWLSAYVDGCYQNLHADRPHGPWAFVYSLTLPRQGSKFNFSGGSTLVMQDRIASYWENDSFSTGVESKELFHSISPNFNRLIIFDPRLPHGVEQVRGTHDIRESRLVLHGWFTEPKPYFDGSTKDVPIFYEFIGNWLKNYQDNHELPPMQGTWMFRLKILPNGNIPNIQCLWDRVFSQKVNRNETIKMRKALMAEILNTKLFAKRTKRTELTIPVALSH